MTITIAVRNRIASVRGSPAPEIVCGNSDYVLSFDWDAEWDEFDAVTCCIISYSEGGTTRSEIMVSDGTVTVPVQQNVYAVEIGLTAGDIRTTTPARISCLRCITDGASYEASAAFDVYNHMTEYIAGVKAGIHSKEELAVMYQELLDHMNDHPDPGEFPSEAYRTAIAAPQRISRITGTLTLSDGTETELSENEIVANSLSIRTDCMTDEYVLPGGVPAAELNVTLRGQEYPELLFGAEIAPVFQLRLLSGAWYDVPLGVFTVSSAESAADDQAEITAYDDMQQLSFIPFSSLGLTAGQAYTAAELIEICGEVLGLDVVFDGTMLNSSVKYVAASAGNRIESARDLLMFAVQTLGAFAFIDRFRTLRVRAIAVTDPVATVSAAQRKTLSASRQQYRTFQVNTVFSYPDADGNTIVEEWEYTTLWPDGVTAQMQENPLWSVIDSASETRRGQITSALINITRALDPVVFTPLTSDVYDDPSVELFEWRQFTRGSSTFSAPITAIEWTHHEAQTITACGAEAVAGILRSQAEKQALSVRLDASQEAVNFHREMYLGLIQTTGHQAMVYHTHEWLAHFTQGELSGEDDTE